MYKNDTGIPLSIAIWLATDTYDHNKTHEKYISATTLLQPLRAIILNQTMPQQEEVDIVDLVPSRLGTAVHDQIEAAWKRCPKKVIDTLRKLGYPEEVCHKFIINPDPKSVSDADLPIYMEKRAFKEIEGWTVGGKFDVVINGRLTDYKTTKSYSWISGSNVPNYIKQASIYRWLHPDIIKKDFFAIAYIFTDWIKQKALADKKYPQNPVIEREYELMSAEETEAWIRTRLQKINRYITEFTKGNYDQALLPDCTKEELWQNDPIWKYYKDPNKTARSTKNFDNPTDAYARNGADGNKGLVVEVPGEVKRCLYCNAQPACLQAAAFKARGLLK